MLWKKPTRGLSFSSRFRLPLAQPLRISNDKALSFRYHRTKVALPPPLLLVHDFSLGKVPSFSHRSASYSHQINIYLCEAGENFRYHTWNPSTKGLFSILCHQCRANSSTARSPTGPRVSGNGSISWQTRRFVHRQQSRDLANTSDYWITRSSSSLG
jgi:hypothetical protein